MMPPAPSALPTEEPVQTPLPPREECVHSLSPLGGLGVEECRGRSQEETGCSLVPCNEIVVGHNLIGVSFEDKSGAIPFKLEIHQQVVPNDHLLYIL